MARFNKGELTHEALNILMFDIGGLDSCRLDKEDFEYHLKQLKGNLNDLFGVKDEYKYCNACDTETPADKEGDCFCCGQTYKEDKDEL